MSLAATWMDLEIIILSEVSHKKTNIIYNLYVESKNSANGLIYKTNRSTDIESKFMVTKGESGEGLIGRLGLLYTYYCIYNI